VKAIVKYKEGKGFVELRDVPIPVPGPKEVRIKVELAGICTSDLHILNYDIAIAIKTPVVMGHEFSGVIDLLGTEVDGWQVGDRVVAETNYEVCGTCCYCTSGFYNLCDTRKVLGYWHDGAFAPYTVVPVVRLHALPPEISFQQGALIEPIACVVHGLLELVAIKKGDFALITGPGVLGLIALQIAKAVGARVIVSGITDDVSRLVMANKLGADFILNADLGDIDKQVLELTSGNGVDIAIECSGSDRAVRSGIDALRKRGQYLQLGLMGRDMKLRFDTVAYKELKITGSISSRDVSWRRAIEMIKLKEVTPEPLVSDIQPLDNWEKEFARQAERKDLKILFKP
jgi:L-iditol 2-dehydrogenase